MGWLLFNMCRWTPTRLIVMRLMGLSAGCFFPVLMMWPADSEQVRVMVWASDEFSLKSCLSSWNDKDVENLAFDPNELD